MKRLKRVYNLLRELTHKECGKCGSILEAEKFAAKVGVQDGLTAWCNACRGTHIPKSHTPAYQRNAQLKHRYGCTTKQWDALFEQQGRKCACCGATEPGSKRGWHTDHDHLTQLLRGILCNACNVALGFMKDSPERATLLGEYLGRFMKATSRKDAQLEALMELHRQTLAVLQEALALLRSMQPVKQWFTLETQPTVPAPQPLPQPYQPYIIGPYVPPTWQPNTTPIGPIITCGDDLRTAPFGGLPGSGGMTCEGRGGFVQMNATRAMDVVGMGG